ncbi:hypothetical protein FNV43_RR16743 [Rhamnella rubrinervis]|uniref:Uncharacterized protein n=1 Tax=Rhamnella rubrinervis TaxID=2594499 RepID=A0A8K0GZE1_9ROSA|nr:hypothetical protein FNV43_RR16743 [Rhamnella rubrinervis]
MKRQKWTKEGRDKKWVDKNLIVKNLQSQGISILRRTRNCGSDLGRKGRSQGGNLGPGVLTTHKRRSRRFWEEGSQETLTLGGRTLTQGELYLGGRCSTYGERLTWGAKVFDLKSTQSKEVNLNLRSTRPKEESPRPRESLIKGGMSLTQENFNLGRKELNPRRPHLGRVRFWEEDLDSGRPRPLEEVLNLRRLVLDQGQLQPVEVYPQPRESSTWEERSSTYGDFDQEREYSTKGGRSSTKGELDLGGRYSTHGELDLRSEDLYLGRARPWEGGKTSTQKELNLGRYILDPERALDLGRKGFRLRSSQPKEVNLNSGSTRPKEESTRSCESSTYGGKSSTQGELNLWRKSSTQENLDLGREVYPRPKETLTWGGRNSTWGRKTSIQGDFNLERNDLDLGRPQPEEVNLNSENTQSEVKNLNLGSTQPRRLVFDPGRALTCGGMSSTQGDFDLGWKELDLGRPYLGEGELNMGRKVHDPGRTRHEEEGPQLRETSIWAGYLNLGRKDLDLGRKVLDQGKARLGKDDTQPRERSTWGGKDLYSGKAQPGEVDTRPERVQPWEVGSQLRESSTWGGKILDLGSTQPKEVNLNSGSTQPKKEGPRPREGSTWEEDTQPRVSSTWGNLELKKPRPGWFSTHGNLNLMRNELDVRNTQPEEENLNSGILDSGNTQPEEEGARLREHSTWKEMNSTQGTLNLRREISTQGILNMKMVLVSNIYLGSGSLRVFYGLSLPVTTLGVWRGTLPGPPWQPTEDVRLVSMPFQFWSQGKLGSCWEIGNLWPSISSFSSKHSSNVIIGYRDYFREGGSLQGTSLPFDFSSSQGVSKVIFILPQIMADDRQRKLSRGVRSPGGRWVGLPIFASSSPTSRVIGGQKNL